MSIKKKLLVSLASVSLLLSGLSVGIAGASPTKAEPISQYLIAPAAVAEHVIYGPANFYGLDSTGVTTQQNFYSDGNDVQINAKARKNSSQDTGWYSITLLQWHKDPGRYWNMGTIHFYYSPDMPTYVYKWAGVGKGTYAATIARLSSDTGTISGEFTVYSSN